MADYNKKADLEALGFTVSQSYVKRYSDGAQVISDNIANTERGIFYANVTAEKDGETYTYKTTIDVYNSTEPVEYESFGHGDSAYAVKAYYFIGGSNSKSYEELKATYTAKEGTGFEMTVGGKEALNNTNQNDDFLSIKKYGEMSNDNTSTVSTVYGHTNISYLAIDQSEIKDTTPLVYTLPSKSGAAYIHIYVAPRHTKEYYDLFAQMNTGKLKYAYAAGWNENASTAKGITSITNGVAGFFTKQYWSANWQQSTTANQTITLSTIVENYNALFDWEVVMFISQDPAGFASTLRNNGVAKLGSLLF
jgi:hypothetical protein